jgi:hypothetical protein
MATRLVEKYNSSVIHRFTRCQNQISLTSYTIPLCCERSNDVVLPIQVYNHNHHSFERVQGKRKEILLPSVFHRPVGVAAPSGGEQTKGWIKGSLTVRLFFRALNRIFIPLEPEKPTKFGTLSPL